MQININFGEILRDEGASAALENAGESWNKRALDVALRFFAAAGSRGALFEDVRQYASEIEAFPDPPSPNAWGAVCLAMSKKKLIVKTGELRASRAVKSHARAQPVWRINK